MSRSVIKIPYFVLTPLAPSLKEPPLTPLLEMGREGGIPCEIIMISWVVSGPLLSFP